VLPTRTPRGLALTFSVAAHAASALALITLRVPATARPLPLPDAIDVTLRETSTSGGATASPTGNAFVNGTHPIALPAPAARTHMARRQRPQPPPSRITPIAPSEHPPESTIDVQAPTASTPPPEALALAPDDAARASAVAAGVSAGPGATSGSGDGDAMSAGRGDGSDVATSCDGSWSGVWVGLMFFPRRQEWSRLELTITQRGGVLSGTIVNLEWVGHAGDRAPARCDEGGLVSHVRMPAGGSVRGRAFTFASDRFERLADDCWRHSYNPDRFVGQLDDDGRMFARWYDDGRFRRGQPIHLTRVSCASSRAR
jgi:hypothetical protein